MTGEKEKKLFDAITQIRDDLIMQAPDIPLKSRRPNWIKWASLAACAVLVFGAGAALIENLHPIFMGGGGEDGGGHAGESSFMSYAGPVFPLTLEEPQEGITAGRKVLFDFSHAGDETLQIRGAGIQDDYTLFNSSGRDKNVTALYPFISSFGSLPENLPAVSVDGRQAQPRLYAGDYSGSFKGVIGEDDPDGTVNLQPLDSWEGYKNLLGDGSYQQNALSPYPALSQKVCVYEFSDFTAPLEEYRAATQAVSFQVDPQKTTILQYGFEGTEWDETGYHRFSFFVPDGKSMRPERKLLIVLGEDIGDYTMQGYKNGAVKAGNELDNVSSKVTRTEAVLSQVVDELLDEYFSQYAQGIDENGNVLPGVSKEMFAGAVARLMYEHGVFSDAVTERYEEGRLLDIFSDVQGLRRVFYLEFPVDIPAEGSSVIQVGLHKEPSHDFACSGEENAGLQGYQLAARLGSNLQFETLSAGLTHTEGIEIVRQNFGFDLSGGVSQVELDPQEEYYYLEIRPLEKSD